MDKAIIFGAGRYGEIAASFYRKQYEIIGFSDNNREKWGKIFCGLPIVAPCDLQSIDDRFVVIIAMANLDSTEEVKKQLFDLGIDSGVCFEIVSTPQLFCHNKKDDKELIVSFISGLGNQMFQYALYRYLREKHQNVSMDLSYYIEHKDRQFILNEIFTNVNIEHCNYNNIAKYFKDERKRFIEPNARLGSYEYDYVYLEEMVEGLIRGYHQSYVWASRIRDILLNELVFDISCFLPSELAMANLISEGNFVGIHIRRGDYLNENEIGTFGDICNRNYYETALSYIESNVASARLCFFSDDIEWVKCNYSYDGAIYVEKDMFENYQDWYDMFLMSLCKHNIIANSSFSWWGAWLNRNPQKKVVAPKKWINQCELSDICPPEWIRI